MLALDGFSREEATLTSMSGSAFGGRSRSGYSSVIKPRYISPGSVLTDHPVGDLFSCGDSACSDSLLIWYGFGGCDCGGCCALRMLGDAMDIEPDIGVLGGNGIGCLGALGESGMAGNWPMRADSG